jgi:hypothetical protein
VTNLFCNIPWSHMQLVPIRKRTSIGLICCLWSGLLWSQSPSVAFDFRGGVFNDLSYKVLHRDTSV